MLPSSEPGVNTDERHRWIDSAVGQYEQPLLRYATRILGDPGRAADVVQYAFLKLCQQDRAEVDGHLAPWLYRVTRNRALDHKRKAKRLNQLSDEDLAARPGRADLPETPLEDRETQQQMLDLLEQLPDKQREAIRLKFQSGLAYKEIAEVMDIKVGYVGYLISTGLQALRERMPATT